MNLYASTTSTYARKVRILLLEQKIAHSFITESPSDPDSHVAKLNPLGKVPLLQLDDGELLFNSPMIIEFVDNLADRPMLPVEPGLRWRVQRWHALGDGIMDAVIARMLELHRDVEHQDVAVIHKQESKVASALQFAEQQLGQLATISQFLSGDQLSVADIAFAVALDYINLRYPHNWADNSPRVKSWLLSMQQRQSLRDTYV